MICCYRARRATPWTLKKSPRRCAGGTACHTFGQSLLIARRLIDAGTRFVQVNWPSH
jgi:hypothetical protein